MPVRMRLVFEGGCGPLFEAFDTGVPEDASYESRSISALRGVDGMFKYSIVSSPFAHDDRQASISMPNAKRMAQIMTRTVQINDTKT
jgi:hypothetical protein